MTRGLDTSMDAATFQAESAGHRQVALVASLPVVVVAVALGCAGLVESHHTHRTTAIIRLVCDRHFDDQPVCEGLHPVAPPREQWVEDRARELDDSWAQRPIYAPDQPIDSAQNRRFLALFDRPYHYHRGTASVASRDQAEREYGHYQQGRRRLSSVSVDQGLAVRAARRRRGQLVVLGAALVLLVLVSIPWWWFWQLAQELRGTELRLTAHRIRCNGHDWPLDEVASLELVGPRIRLVLRDGTSVTTAKLPIDLVDDADALCQAFDGRHVRADAVDPRPVPEALRALLARRRSS